MQSNPGALFLDRDGTLIVHKPYLHRPDDIEILPGVSSALGTLQSFGFQLFLFTNQSGIGRGWFTLADVKAVHTRMIELIGLGPNIFKAICIAPETPEQPSHYRKPSPKFICEQMAAYALHPSRCWMVGDTPSDWRSGLAAGISAIAVGSDLTTLQTEDERIQLDVPLFPGLPEAVDHIIHSGELKL